MDKSAWHRKEGKDGWIRIWTRLPWDGTPHRYLSVIIIQRVLRGEGGWHVGREPRPRPSGWRQRGRRPFRLDVETRPFRRRLRERVRGHRSRRARLPGRRWAPRGA